VRTLAKGVMTAGPHQLSWDGTRDDGKRAAAGLYFYRLEVAEKTMFQRVALLP
jgi:flagellar hook assembly protein FlgD